MLAAVNQPAVTIRSGSRPITPAEAAAFNVPRDATVRELWIEDAIDGGPWMLAARVMPDANGNPIIGELRVFPKESRRPTDRPGQWSAQARGIAAPVPRGGLPATILRRRIRLSDYESHVRRAFGPLAELLRDPFRLASDHPDHPVAEMLTNLIGAGFVLRPSTPSQPGAVGRRPVPDIEYAQLARDYVAAGKNPIAELAQKWKKSPIWITSRVARARRRGFLTKASTQGKAEGQLTAKAEAILTSALVASVAPRQRRQRRPSRPKRARTNSSTAERQRAKRLRDKSSR